MFAFNGLLVGLFVVLAYLPIGKLPDRRTRPVAVESLTIQPVELPATASPFSLTGAWVLDAADPRFAGLSGLALDNGRFLAVSDLGAIIRFDRPTASRPRAANQDLAIGPGKFGKKRNRDAESLVRDPRGRGWWVGYEQHHSLWLYDPGFTHALSSVDLSRLNWWANRGAEGLIVRNGQLLVLAENGRDAVKIDTGGSRLLKLHSNADIAEAATAPDGSAWVLLRQEGLKGLEQSIAPLLDTKDGYSVGPSWPVPKGPFDNYEGMSIEALPDGRWRFWLVTDNGHRVMARTLLVALDLDSPIGNRKSPATSTGPLQKQTRRKL